MKLKKQKLELGNLERSWKIVFQVEIDFQVALANSLMLDKGTNSAKQVHENVVLYWRYCWVVEGAL